MALLRCAVAATFSTLLATQSHAATRTWDGGGGPGLNFFDVGANWSDNFVPGALDTALFNLPGITTVRWDNLTGNTTNLALQVTGGDVRFTSDNVAGAPFSHTTTSDSFVTNFSALRLTNFILNNTAFFDVINAGTVEVSTNARLNLNNLTVGFAGITNTLTAHSGGIVSATGGGVFLGEVNGSEGTVVVDDAGSSFFSQRNLVLGGAGTTGKGTFTTSDGGRVGIGRSGVGTAFAGALTIGDDDGTGATGGNLLINNGSVFNHNSGGITQIAGFANHHGKIEVSGANSLFRSAGDIQVGLAGKGFLTLANGGKAATDAVLRVGYLPGAVGTVNIGSGSQLDVANDLTLGELGGVANVTIASGGRLNVGDGAAALIIDDYSVIDDSSSNASDGGTLFVQSGSVLTNNASGISIGRAAGHSGRVVVSGSGSIVNAGAFAEIGNGGTGIVNVSGGGKFIANEFIDMSYNAGGTGTATVDGSGSLLWSKGDLNVGNNGASSITLTNGGDLRVGDAAADVGPAFDFVVSDSDPIGTAGGVVTVANGSKLNNSAIAVIGLFGTQTGRVRVTGAGSEWISGGHIQIGNAGDATSDLLVESGGSVKTLGALALRGQSSSLSISGGGVVEANGIILSDLARPSTSTVSGTNSRLITPGQLEVGRNGTATLDINSGGKVTAANAILGVNATGVGTINLNDAGSLLDVEGDLTVGLAGIGIINHNAGALIRIGDQTTTDNARRFDISDSNLAGNGGGNVRLNNFSTFVTNGFIGIASTANSYGRLDVTGGSSFSANSSYFVGDMGTGFLNVTSGGRVLLPTTTAQQFILGLSNGGRGTVVVDGSGSLVDVETNILIGNAAGDAVSTFTVRNSALLLVGDIAALPIGLPNTSVNIADGTLDGSAGGIIDIRPGSLLDASGDILVGVQPSTFGRINASGTNARVTAGGGLSIGAIGTGRLDVTGGGKAQATTMNINNGQANLSGAGSTINANTLFVGSALSGSAATFNVSGGQVTVATGGSLSVVNGGTLNLSGGKLVTPAVTVNASTFNFTGGTLVAKTFNGQLTQNGGTNSPGDTGVRDLMTITGGYSFNSGTLAIDLFSSNTDVIASNGPVSLAGVLALNNISFPTTLGTSQVMIDAPSRTGVFTSVTGLVLSPTRYVAVTYNPNGVILKIARPGDANIDGSVTFDDLLLLAQNYNSAATGRHWQLGDFNGTGITDFDDLLLLAQNYGLSGLGMPIEVGPNVSPAFAADWALALSLVPEPNVVLTFLGIGSLFGRTRESRESADCQLVSRRAAHTCAT